MRTPRQEANLDRLIQHYRDVPAVTSWWWDQCIGGIAYNMGMTPGKGYVYLMEVLGISLEESRDMIGGPNLPIHRLSKATVVKSLEALKVSSPFEWKRL